MATAAAGVVAGHALAYSAAVPGDQERAVMDATGHGYWSTAVALATCAFAGAIAAIFGRRLRTAGLAAPSPSIATTATRLAVIQLGMFTALEVGERLAAGEPLSTLSDHHVFVTGLVAQVVVAAAVAAIATLLDRAAVALAEWLDERPLVPLPLQLVSIGIGIRYANAHQFARTSRGPPRDTSTRIH